MSLFFSRKIHFCPILGKKRPKLPPWTQSRVFWIFWKKFSLIFLGNNLKLKKYCYWYLNINSISDKTLVSSYGPKCYQPIKLQGSLKCNISRKKWMMNFIFGMQINIEVFCKLILLFLLCITSHVPSNQNKFAYLCSISRKASGMRLIFFLHINTKTFYKLNHHFEYAYKLISKWPTSWFQHFGHQSFLQGDTSIIGEHNEAFSKYSK